MCGIVGYIGGEKAPQYVLDGLKRLEYRGYDSAGIASIFEGEIHLRRRKGKLLELANLLVEQPLFGEIAIGHTRWATHGIPSEENAHPHRADDIILVHNGIIENYLELRTHLLSHGREFRSQTDTEIIAHLIAVEKGPDLTTRVRNALQMLRGAYAIVVMSTQSPDTLVVAKNASPLIIGLCEGATMVASDIPAILPYTRDVIILNEGQMATIGKEKPLCLEIATGAAIQPTVKHIQWSPVMAEKGGYKHFMMKEIMEQPRAVVDALRGRLKSNEESVLLEADAIAALDGVEQMIVTACGTSYYAGMVGRLLIEQLAEMPCEIELASELRYRHPLVKPHTMLLAISQSGETADTLAAVKMMQGFQAKILGIINAMDSSITRESDATLYTNAGPEIGVASTKAFITQVIALILLACHLAISRGKNIGMAQEILRELRKIPQQIEEVLKQSKHIQEISKHLLQTSSALFIGRGLGYPVALEGALKLKEVSYIHAEGYAAGEMKHGPIALIEQKLPVVAIATDSPVYDKMMSNIAEVRARDAEVIAIGTQKDHRLPKVCQHVIYVPSVHPFLSPLIDTIALQLLAYYTADAKGLDVDQPRNLAKSVTVE